MDSTAGAKPRSKAQLGPEWPKRITSEQGRRKVEVTIYRRQRADGRLVFEVSDYSTGRRRLRGFAEETEAMKEANRIAGHLARGEDFAANFGAADRAAMGRALTLLAPTGDALEVATARYAEAVTMLGGPGKGGQLVEAVRYFIRHNPQNLPQKSVADAVERFIESRRNLGKSSRYVTDLESRLGRFSQEVKLSMAELTPQLICEWLDALLSKRGGGLTTQSRENYRRVISGLCEFAVGKGWLLENPVAKVERHDVGERDVRIYRPEEFAALLHAAEPCFVPFLVLGGFAGVRSAEIERLTWRDVNLTAGHVVIGAKVAKVKSRRVVPLPECAVRWLLPLVNKEGPVWPLSHDEIHDWQTDTAKRAGLTWIPNGLRHSAASYLLAKFGDAGRVAGWLGNSADIVHRHYKALATEAEASQWFSIETKTPRGVIPFHRDAVEPRTPDMSQSSPTTTKAL